MKDLLQTQDPANTPFWKKVIAGGASGMCGAALATPTDLVKGRMLIPLTYFIVRMQAATSERVYRNCFHGFSEIYSSDGIRGLYRGIGPTTQRAILLTGNLLFFCD
jgi:solute carrier family 25 protein 14/30